MKLKWIIDCRIFKKHRYSIYDDRCIVCGKPHKKKRARHYT